MAWAAAPATTTSEHVEKATDKGTVSRSIENRPDVMERIRLAIEKMSKQKTALPQTDNSQKVAKKNPVKSSTAQTAELTKKNLEHAPSWSYSGANGPERWGLLSAENRLCMSGQQQAPIAIEESATLPLPGMEELVFDYDRVGGQMSWSGQSLQLSLPRGADGPTLMVRGSRYRLTRLEFHHPAEEQINGQQFAMGLHLIHQNTQGETAIVAVLFELGNANPGIQTLWAQIPLSPQDTVHLPTGALNLQALLPGERKYYQFLGSLTQPPCSEGVLWQVFQQPLTMSATQLAIVAKLLPNNARPLQPLNGRVIKAAQ